MRSFCKFILPIFCALLVLCLGIMIYRCFFARVIITDAEISVEETAFHPSNDRQYNASVWMDVYNKQLYFCPQRKEGSKMTAYQNWICRFEKGNVRKLYRLNDDLMPRHRTSILTELDGNVIYVRYDPFSVCRVNLDTNADRVLYSDSGPDSIWLYHFVPGENDLLCPLPISSHNEPTFLHIGSTADTKVLHETCGYKMGDAEYLVHRGYYDQAEQILCKKDGIFQVLSLGGAERRSLIPSDHGILIHNEGWKDILYIIKEDGTVTELFRVDCLESVTAVTVHGENVYLSLRRYQEYGPMEIGFLRSENDEMEGLYRISLLDGTVEKLSDTFYDGLYVFDDSGIFACDEFCSIYKLDFNGNVINTMMEVKH